MQKHFQELVRALSEKANTAISVGDDGRIFCDCGEFPLLIEYLEGPGTGIYGRFRRCCAHAGA